MGLALPLADLVSETAVASRTREPGLFSAQSTILGAGAVASTLPVIVIMWFHYYLHAAYVREQEGGGGEEMGGGQRKL